jgi:probable metal-binding protein
MNTTENVHGHEVLRLVSEAPTPLTRAQLETEITRLFGAEARFCTCSAADMTREELLGFLLSKGKIVERHGRLATDPSRICDHGEGEHDHAD